MAKIDEEKAFEGLLTGNLTRVNDFLKFAETKNAALVTFCSAWIVAIFNLMGADRFSATKCKVGFAIALFFLAAACIISACSFLPQLRGSSANKDAEKKDSILFFDNIAELDVSIFCATLRAEYHPTDAGLYSKRYLSDLMHQMHSNSQIARKKFRLFGLASIFAGLGIILVAIPVTFTAFSMTKTVQNQPIQTRGSA